VSVATVVGNAGRQLGQHFPSGALTAKIKALAVALWNIVNVLAAADPADKPNAMRNPVSR
jgi:hypothetical protein